MQGRFKRDGSAAAEQEPRGGTDRGSSPQHIQGQGQSPVIPGDGGDRAGPRPGTGPGGPGININQGGPGAAAGAPPGEAPPGGESAPPSKPAKRPSGAGSRIALRNWRISTRLVSLLTLPVVAATTLGGLRINESMDRMKQLEHMQLLTDMTQEATKLAAALQAERDLTAGPLANDPTASDSKVTAPRLATDRAEESFFAITDRIPNEGDDTMEAIRSTASQIASQVKKLKDIREKAFKKDEPSSLTVEEYHRLIEALLELSSEMAQATNNPDMIKRTRALAAFSSAKEYSSMSQAIIAAALPGGGEGDGKPVGKGPGLKEIDRLYGASALEKHGNEMETFDAVYESAGGNATELTEPLENGNSTMEAATQYATRALGTPGTLGKLEKRTHLDWTDDYGVRIDAMATIEATLLDEMETRARQLREESQQEAIINLALILIVLGVSLIGAFVVARSMIRSLRRLQDTATRVAQDRLPELVKQLSESDPQDVDTSVESVGVHSRDEIGKVATAFDDVHREAVRLAAEQALLRGNVNAMFTNLSRRSQGLIQRQLSLISELESREADPDQLSSLFKLDHLATRMRRNGENLLVLAGEEPGRRWTRPVPLVDVLRAAASEVEQYERIELAAVPATEVAGRVVNDLVHLLAELLENATSFSSPQTKVRVTGHALPDGRVLVEIHDTGIGLSPEDLAAINERLASPPTVDVSVSRRMGLFVVGRLSLRHGIRIQLRPSDSGGTTALVMLPVDVAHGGKKAPGAPGVPGSVPPPPGGGPAGLGGNRPGGTGAPGSGRPGGPGAPSGGLLGTGAPRDQVGAGAGSGPRAALPTRDGGPGQGRHGGGLAGAFGGRGANKAPARDGAPAGGLPPREPADRGRQLPPAPLAELPGAAAPVPGPAGWTGEQQPGVRPADSARGHDDRGYDDRGRVEGGRDELGYGERGRDDRARDDRGTTRGPGSTEEFPRPDFDAPPPPPRRPAPTGIPAGQYVRPDVFGPPAPAHSPAHPGPPGPPSDRSGQSGPSEGPGLPGESGLPDRAGPPERPVVPGRAPGQFAPPRDGAQEERGRDVGQDPAATQPFPRPDLVAPAPPAPGRAPAPRGYEGYQGDADTGTHNALPPQPQPEALPPAAGPGDGRTPLYDTLETDWFHTQGRGGRVDQPGAGDRQEPVRPAAAPEHTQQIPQVPQQPAERPLPPMPRRSPATAPTAAHGPQGTHGTHGSPGQGTNGNGWRSSPNDELVRQAERVRKPAAGGVTTSGLPRRVPRANLVAGTAQEQNAQTGPQVSRAPDDVRGRLTNLRRGIQQGREQNSSTTGSFNLGPTHQQER
ncbi:nitrate- and nitrite sensing domain-containing protein [Streptomyces sp. NPDC051018]|uniref:sensor histidine kinase n=1 Tax=Streptomyces sp. NPDC051018 TaxID=3365639 RepID=UPI003796F26C